MTIQPTTTATGNTTLQNSGTQSGSLQQTFDSFLKLLTTQLKYQDPVSPMDTNEFTSQLVQFSQVEQSIQQNDNLETLIALQGANQIAFASSLTGKDIEIEGNALEFESGGKLNYGYSLASKALSTQINIMDEKGNIIFTTTGETAAGNHEFVWDGLNSEGEEVEPGTYRIQVVPKDAAGEPIETMTSVFLGVEGVELANGQIALDVGKFTVPLGNVLAIRERQASA